MTPNPIKGAAERAAKATADAAAGAAKATSDAAAAAAKGEHKGFFGIVEQVFASALGDSIADFMKMLLRHPPQQLLVALLSLDKPRLKIILNRITEARKKFKDTQLIHGLCSAIKDLPDAKQKEILSQIADLSDADDDYKSIMDVVTGTPLEHGVKELLFGEGQLAKKIRKNIKKSAKKLSVKIAEVEPTYRAYVANYARCNGASETGFGKLITKARERALKGGM